MPADFSWLHQAMPIFGFILVFVVAYAVLAKTKVLGDGKGVNGVVSFIVSIIFLSFSQVRNFVLGITPWMVVLIMISFFFLLIIYFIAKNPASITKPFSLGIIIAFLIIVIVAFFYSFPSTQAILPGTDETQANDFVLKIKHFIFGGKFLSSVLLLVLAIIVWVIIIR